MSSKTQYLEKQSRQNAPAPAHTVSARRAKPSVRMALALALAAFAIWRPALAEGPAQRYAIPAGSLEHALMEFAVQADLKLIFKTDLVRSARSAGLTGTLTPEQGVARLLEASGISYRFVDSNTVTIEPVAPVDPLKALVAEAKPPMDYAGAAEPAPTKPQAPPKKTQEGPTVLPEMTVTASPVNATSYSVPNASTATKTDTPIFDTPVSIQVVPRQVIEDQKTPSLSGGLKEALENVSSVRPAPLASLFNGFIIRGFVDSAVFRNGLRDSFNSFDTANLDAIEVLKGPAAVLYGRVEPGGLINLVTKKPLAVPYYSLEQQFGSYDFYRTEWDATGPVTQDKSLSYRFTGTYQNNDTFRDFETLERILVHPSLTWRPSPATELSLDLEYLRDEGRFILIGIPAMGDRPAPIPIGRTFQDPNDPDDDFIENIRLGFQLTHRFNETWTLQNRFLATLRDSEDVDLFSFGLQPDDRTLDRGVLFQGITSDAYATNLDLTGKLSLWNLDHAVLVGFDYLRADSDGPFAGDFENIDPALAIDIFDPTFGLNPNQFRRENIPTPGLSRNETQWYGVYFQDHITLWDKLYILGGGRYDWATVASACCDVSPVSLNERKDEEFSPRAGVLYQPWPWLGVYGSWVQSFGTNNGRGASGEALPPETGEQYEVGLKTQLLDQQLSGTLAFYHLTKENIVTPDLSTPAPFDSAPIGEARSQGIELDIAGRITDKLSLIGSYAFTDADITEDNSGLQGNRLPNVPEHAGSLWLKYDIKGFDAPEGLSFGLGVFAAERRDGDSQNTFSLPGYARLDALVGYRWKLGPSRLSAQLNIRNALDKEYFESTDFQGVEGPARTGIMAGAPLTVLGSIRVEF